MFKSTQQAAFAPLTQLASQFQHERTTNTGQAHRSVVVRNVRDSGSIVATAANVSFHRYYPESFLSGHDKKSGHSLSKEKIRDT